MPGYTGYHTNKKSNWSPTTITAVVVVHIVLAAGLYRLSQTEFVQDLIKVSKLTTVQEPVKPPDPPPSEKEPEPEAKPEPKPDPPPVVKELPPEPAVPQAPVEDRSPAPASVGDGSDSAKAGTTPFAIGKGRGRFALYEDLLMGSIQAVYQQPADLSDTLEYAVLCQLVLDEEGFILAYQLLNSSGSEVFDRSAQQALSRLRQVRPPPKGMSRTVVVKFFPP
ncbi:MAG: TonB C-terminal domain-containing protein [Nitrospira sp.]|nr:TonB C-terminal domain-containing protein [Nitrospira sp.]